MARQNIEDADAILGRYIPVLDFGFVALVDYMGGDVAIETAARQSYQSQGRSAEDTEKLLRHLLRHKHTSPFEMTELVFQMAMPIFVARQFVRHRTASINEMSGRYTELPMVFYTPERTRKQSQMNKQGSSEEVLTEIQETHAGIARNQLRDMAAEQYQRLLDYGSSKELARIDLPLSMYTIWTIKFDLWNLMHFLRLRTDFHAQQEARAYANVMAALARLVAPISMEAWKDYIACAQSFSRQEMELIHRRLHPHPPGGGSDPTSGRMTPREMREFEEKLCSQDYAFLSLQQLSNWSVSAEVAMMPFTKEGV